MRYRTIFFDLDGTLIDSAPGIIVTLRLLMEELSIPVWPDEQMYKLIGPPFIESFPQYFGMNEEEVNHAVSVFRRHFPKVHEDPAMVQPFVGVPEMLRALREADGFVGIVSSKIRYTAEAQLESFGLLPYVNYVGCSTEHAGGNKEALLRETITSLRVKSEAVMVGDRLYDLNAANAVGIDSIGVLYGYGTEAELADCKPTYLVDSVQALKELLLS